MNMNEKYNNDWILFFNDPMDWQVLRPYNWTKIDIVVKE